MKGKGAQLLLKRLMDFMLSLIGLVILAIPFAIIALAIKLDSKGGAGLLPARAGRVER